MRRRNIISGETAKKAFQAHTLFVVILTVGAFFRIVSEEEIDRNTVIFSTIQASGVIIALSLFNRLAIDLCNDLNDKWTIINYFIPGILLALIVLVFKIPIESFDVMLSVILMAIANFVVYSIEKGGTHSG
jgi:hypothetical protein